MKGKFIFWTVGVNWRNTYVSYSNDLLSRPFLSNCHCCGGWQHAGSCTLKWQLGNGTKPWQTQTDSLAPGFLFVQVICILISSFKRTLGITDCRLLSLLSRKTRWNLYRCIYIWISDSQQSLIYWLHINVDFCITCSLMTNLRNRRIDCLIPFLYDFSASQPLSPPAVCTLLPLSSLSLNSFFFLSSPFLSSCWRNARVLREASYERYGIPVCSAVSGWTGWKGAGRHVTLLVTDGNETNRNPPLSLCPSPQGDFIFSCSPLLMPPKYLLVALLWRIL